VAVWFDWQILLTQSLSCVVNRVNNDNVYCFVIRLAVCWIGITTLWLVEELVKFVVCQRIRSSYLILPNLAIFLLTGKI